MTVPIKWDAEGYPAGGGHMTEKPIIFSGPMVRAILGGRKRQTRRVVMPQPPADCDRILGPEWYEPVVVDRYGEEQPGAPIYGIYDEDGEWGIKCPYAPGDVLWVRETWLERPDPDLELGGIEYKYKATDYVDAELVGGWRSPIYMPRRAARLFLRVTNVRVERLHEISEADAIAEGVGHGFVCNSGWPDYLHIENGVCTLTQDTARMSFATLWDSINAHRGWGWERNPLVWVVEFVRCT